ncbi:MAG TPA: FAD-binding oxidoreductase [Ktedonobacterales bacterium]|nr:FAD-binding oxidoreductase [Ktedonobacterales bacterium]
MALEGEAALAWELAERLLRALGADGMLSGADGDAYAVQGVAPLAVARPDEIDGVCAAVAAAAELDVPVLPWGGGTRQAIGYPPRQRGLVLSLERLTRVIEYDPADLTVTVQAGITHAALAARLAREGQTLPLDVALPGRATVGGTLAVGGLSGGLRRAFYGGARDTTLGLRVVDASGGLIRTGGRVVKNVTGYDMTKLFIGALGTLGVIVEASFKLAPLPETEATVLGIFPQAARAFEAVPALEALALRPSALAAVQVDALPELAHLGATHGDFVLFAVRLPGPATAVERAVREARAVLQQAGARTILEVEHAAHEAFWAPLERLAAAGTSSPSGRSEALLRLPALPSELPEALEMARALAQDRVLALAWLADAATGTLWLRLHTAAAASSPSSPPFVGSYGGRPASPGDEDRFSRELADLLGELQRAYPHTIVLDCPPTMKADLPIWGTPPPAVSRRVMRDLRQRLDPASRLNPGRYLPDLEAGDTDDTPAPAASS